MRDRIQIGDIIETKGNGPARYCGIDRYYGEVTIKVKLLSDNGYRYYFPQEFGKTFENFSMIDI